MPAARWSFPAPRSSQSLWRWAVGGWWGWEGGAGVGLAGDCPLASCHRLWDGWKGQRGRWLWGPLRHGGGSITPKCYSPPPPVPPLPPAAALAESRGQGSQTCRCALSPPNTPHCGSRRCFLGVAPPRARPLSPPGPPPTGWVGAGRTVPSAPWAGRTIEPEGCFSVTPVGEVSAGG